MLPRSLGEFGLPDLVVFNAGELATCAGPPEDPLGLIEDGALEVQEGRIAWVGTTKAWKRRRVGKPGVLVDAEGGLVTPGFVDPHTHLVFAGSREDELERKVAGESYTSILSSGGGIQRTVRDTRAASFKTIVSESAQRLKSLVSNGVTTVEVKTGYGQDLADELKLLDVIGALAREGRAELVPTLLGLHAPPPGSRRTSDYVAFAVRELLPRAAEHFPSPRFSDCFCEEGVFSRRDCLRYLKASKMLGYPLKVHADEFSDSGGASLAAEVGCTSADHLGMASAEGIREMAESKVTAVLLPGTSQFSGIPFANAKKIREAGCTVALGTDLSPNSWVESPQLVMSLACTQMRMTPAAALMAFTANAAKAIGRDDIGRIREGAPADFVVHSFPSYRFLPYRIGGSYVRRVFRAGRETYSAAGG